MKTNLATLHGRCDLIVAISHMSLSENFELSRQLSGVDNVIRRPVISISNQPYPESSLADYRRRYQAPPDHPLLEVTPTMEEDLLRYALFVMLRSTRFEIALLNKGALTPLFLDTQKDSLTLEDIAAFTRTNDPLVTMRLTGEDLKNILQRAKGINPDDETSLRVLAVEDYGNPSNYTLQPYHTEIQDKEVYAVVTTRYLAQGGDGYPPFRKGTSRREQFTGDNYITASDEPEAGEIALNDILIRYLPANIETDISSPQDFYQQDKFLNKPLLLMRFGKDYREIRLAFFAKNDFTKRDQDAGFELNAKYSKDFGALKHGSIVRRSFLINQPNRQPGDEKALID